MASAAPAPRRKQRPRTNTRSVNFFHGNPAGPSNALRRSKGTSFPEIVFRSGRPHRQGDRDHYNNNRAKGGRCRIGGRMKRIFVLNILTERPSKGKSLQGGRR